MDTVPVKKLHSLALIGPPLALALSACGTSETTDDTKSGDNAGGPVSITDSRGDKIELDNPATRVVSLEWMHTVSLVSLGLIPVAHADGEIGTAHVCTPVTNAPLVCRLLLLHTISPLP